ncbi:MAG: GNAT family N-acetyltransferase [Chloroflexota bacterium]|nr:GNAT family N-acetyltransferase [Chloroflexota bacterium]
MELYFRIANHSDIDVLMEAMRQFYAIDDYPFDEQTARVTLEKIVDDSSLGRVWLFQKEDEAIGYLVVTFGYSLEYLGRDAFIDEVFVKAAQRNQGVGTKAIQFALEACPALGIHALHLEVERTNVAGQKLYRKFGFEDHDRYLMTKKLIAIIHPRPSL